MLQVTGLRSPFMQRVDEQGDLLTLVPLESDKLDGLKISGLAVYERAEIAKGTYPALQRDLGRLRTISVGASLMVSRTWADQNATAFRYLTDTVQGAMEEIRERVGAD